MIQLENEKFTARQAVDAGLIEANKRRETRLECHAEKIFIPVIRKFFYLRR